MNKILEYINHYPKETKRVIGIGAQQLKTLIENAHIMSEKKKRTNKTRSRQKKSLKVEEEIILTLYYLHHIPTFQILGINFGVSASTANNIFHYWVDILRELLPTHPARGVGTIIRKNSWYATQRLMALIDNLGKIYYCPLKSNRAR